MSKYMRVEGQPDLVKDTRTGAVLNSNPRKSETARKAKEKRQEEKAKREEIENQVNELQRNLMEMKELLRMAISKGKE